MLRRLLSIETWGPGLASPETHVNVEWAWQPACDFSPDVGLQSKLSWLRSEFDWKNPSPHHHHACIQWMSWKVNGSWFWMSMSGLHVCMCAHMHPDAGVHTYANMHIHTCTHHIHVKIRNKNKVRIVFVHRGHDCLCRKLNWRKNLELTKDYSNGSGYKVSMPKPAICFRSK